jgi:hypothetical protein
MVPLAEVLSVGDMGVRGVVEDLHGAAYRILFQHLLGHLLGAFRLLPEADALPV